MPLRHQLGADDDVDTALRDLVEFVRMRSIEVIRSLDSTMMRAPERAARPPPPAARRRGRRRPAILGLALRAGIGRGIEKPQ